MGYRGVVVGVELVYELYIYSYNVIFPARIKGCMLDALRSRTRRVVVTTEFTVPDRRDGSSPAMDLPRSEDLPRPFVHHDGANKTCSWESDGI